MPLIVAKPGNAVMVTYLLPEDPFPQLFVGVAVILPELPGVVVKLEPDPELGVQSAGAPQL